jgi:hypothetical protein
MERYNLDTIFDDFKIWIKSKEDRWKERGVVVDKIAEATHAHQIHVKLHSQSGYGHIGLFENNNTYWIEFEGVARNFENFYKCIEIGDELPNFDEIEIAYIDFLIKENLFN